MKALWMVLTWLILMTTHFIPYAYAHARAVDEQAFARRAAEQQQHLENLREKRAHALYDLKHHESEIEPEPAHDAAVVENQGLLVASSSSSSSSSSTEDSIERSIDNADRSAAPPRSRRMSVTVTTETELQNAIANDATIELGGNIVLTPVGSDESAIRIQGVTGLVINGNG